jgi:hypothetical protein
MTSLRPIAALNFPDIEAGGADMARPVFTEVAPGDLVDETYQRQLTRRSLAVIRSAVARWDALISSIVIAYHVDQATLPPRWCPARSGGGGRRS